jgi:hypothetical protein
VGFVATGPPANQWLALHLRVMREEHDYGLWVGKSPASVQA